MQLSLGSSNGPVLSRCKTSTDDASAFLRIKEQQLRIKAEEERQKMQAEGKVRKAKQRQEANCKAQQDQDQIFESLMSGMP